MQCGGNKVFSNKKAKEEHAHTSTTKVLVYVYTYMRTCNTVVGMQDCSSMYEYRIVMIINICIYNNVADMWTHQKIYTCLWMYPQSCGYHKQACVLSSMIKGLYSM